MIKRLCVRARVARAHTHTHMHTHTYISVNLIGNLIHNCSDGVYVYGKATLRMEENYVHSNQDSGVTVHEAGTNAVISRNYMQVCS